MKPSRPLSYNQARLLELVRLNPGLSRSELGKLMWPELNQFYYASKARNLTAALLKRGLVEFDTIREGGRWGSHGVYLVGQPRAVKPGYLGVFGWVYPKEKKSKVASSK